MLLLVLGIVLATAAPVHAAPSNLRDPFRPLLTQETDDDTTAGDPTTTGDPTTDTTDPTAVDDPNTPPADDGLPTTGSETTNWLAAAYLLLAVGALLIVFGRFTRSPGRGVGT